MILLIKLFLVGNLIKSSLSSTKLSWNVDIVAKRSALTLLDRRKQTLIKDYLIWIIDVGKYLENYFFSFWLILVKLLKVYSTFFLKP